MGARLTPDDAAVSRASRQTARFAKSAGLDKALSDRLAVVVEEWVANVVEYARADPHSRIVLNLRLGDGVVHLSFSDAGQPFDPTRVAFTGPNPDRGGGAGLAMIASLCSSTAYARRGGRNRLDLEMRLA